MIQWFHQNFEDPAQHTSYISAEGGYLWNHGGPYDAKEQLFYQFGDIVSEALIKEVAKDVESDGIGEWAGTTQHENDDYEPPPEPPPFDSFSDEPTEQYGSPRDYRERERTRAALRALLAALDPPKPVGIGHDNPPDDLVEIQVIEELKSDAIALWTEFEKPNPSIALIKRWGASLQSVAAGSIKWIGRKADLAVDTAIKTVVPLAVTGVGVVGCVTVS
jgi:hypothetical protein